MKRIISTMIIGVLSLSCSSPENSTIRIGSKKFTESVIIAEIATQLLNYNGFKSVHLDQLGGTRILFNSLLNNELDVYPEYTGTIIKEILNEKNITDFDDLKNELRSLGIGITEPLGFNNTYSIGILTETAKKYEITKISDLRNYPELKLAFTNEFIDREDGWKGLRNHYDLTNSNVTGIDHDLAYRGLKSGSIDIIDLYSTDAEIEYYDILTLEDDLNFFTDYNAVLLYRIDLVKMDNNRINVLRKLESRVDEKSIIGLNASVKLGGESEKLAAALFINREFEIKTNINEATIIDRLLKNTWEHCILVSISLLMAIIIAIPLGILSAKSKKLGGTILNSVGIIQTIPSLALLVFMIPLFGIGFVPAIVALFLYSLLPIVRNTYTALKGIDRDVIESAEVLGLDKYFILRKIELP
ncbi:MAG: ABC transporter permease subunit, partial [Melioribacteraceae bacterium]|nr:ABC transporter permease subunit [Melioribacteraceae bacterium]